MSDNKPVSEKVAATLFVAHLLRVCATNIDPEEFESKEEINKTKNAFQDFKKDLLDGYGNDEPDDPVFPILAIILFLLFIFWSTLGFPWPFR